MPRGVHGNNPKGKDTHRWNNSKMISSTGYTKIRVGKSHPLSDPNGYCYEHILVWISAGDDLKHDEILHHINGDRQDNRWENLQRMTRADHNRHHNKSKTRDDKGRFVGKKAAGHLLDGKEYREMP